MTEIRDVDPQDEQTLLRWWEVCHDAQSDRPVDYFPTWDAARVSLRTPHPDFHFELVGAFADGVMVGAGMVNLPQTDNLRMSYVDVFVDHDSRRRGVGTLLLDEVERRARAAGRELIQVEVFTPPAGAAAGTGFAESRGYRLGNREGAKTIRLAESEGRWAALEARAETVRGDYRVLVWEDDVPDDYARGWCEMLSSFIGMVPLGELELEDGEWTVPRLRAAEERSHEIGQHKFLGAAVAPSGQPVGWTAVKVNNRGSRVGFVDGTMVLPDHRGHRLGLAIKLATHRALRAAHPECELVVTSNADVNEHMNAINEAMGYELIEQLLEYHKRL